MPKESILKRFSAIALIISFLTVLVGYFVLDFYKTKMQNDIYNDVKDELVQITNEQISSKLDIGIINAISIANDGMIQEALKTNNRTLAIEALGKLSQKLKKDTQYQNVKIHIHTKDNRSFLRNWKADKFGDDLSSFRHSVVQVNSTGGIVNTFEVGKAGLSVRSVVPITNNGEHLGSLEFIQGIDSVAKSFDRTKDAFLLLMDNTNAVVDVESKNKLQNYIISQKFRNEKLLENLEKISVKSVVSAPYYIDDNFFYTSVIIKDFQNKDLGVAVAARPIKAVNLAVDEASTIIYIALILLFLAVVLNLIVSLINLKSNVINPIAKLKNSIDSISSGNDLTETIEVERQDEIGDVVNSFNNYLDSIIKGIKQDAIVIDEAKSVITRTQAGLLNTSISSNAHSVGVQILAEEINKLVESTRFNLSELSTVLVAFSNARFDHNVKPIEGVTGEIASILSAAKNTGTTMSGVLAIVDDAAKSLRLSVEDLNKAASKLSDASTTQASALEQTAASIEETVENIKLSSKNTSDMLKLAKELNGASEVGANLAHQTSVSMDDISHEVNEINDAISVIDQIAFQTNILSLNAAVEAATAGEAGKGFAVVAGEVRNLASRSAEAANEIKSIVSLANNKANDGKRIAGEMIQGYNILNQNIEQTTKLIDQVAVAAKEQENAMVQINATVSELDRMTQQNSSIAMNINEMSSQTAQLTQNLQAALDRTTFDTHSKRMVCDPDLMFDFTKLKADHINFKNTSFTKCAQGTRFRVTDHHSCNLGKWIDAHENDPMYASFAHWQKLKEAHNNVHMMTQDVVDLYAGKYPNGQVFAVTNNIEENINKVFDYLDQLREHKCNYLKEDRG
ncbi:MAG: HAMP domain-containing protein [Campylobacterales bacterium]|nr:HAMP domain-containing protein [Campylobacterales bacterium]